jgi:putative tricarboxylic transport membrane protein
MSKFREKLLVSAGFLVISGYVMFEVFTQFAPAGHLGVRPQNDAGLFPLLIAITLFALTVIHIITLFRQKQSTQTEQNSQHESTPNIQSVYILLILIVYITIVNYFGYLVTTPFALFTMFCVLGIKNVLKNIILSTAVTIAVYFIFGTLMNILLPVGRFGLYF